MHEPDETQINTSNDISEKKISNKEPDFDDEGLRKQGYDVIIVGTGLIQSILASALARAGKTVLHCDENDFYGDIDAVMSFNQLLEWVHMRRMKKDYNSIVHDSIDENNLDSIELKSSYNSLIIDSSFDDSELQDVILDIGMKVSTPYGCGTVVGLPTDTVVGEQSVHVTLDHWTLANGKSPIASFGIDNFNDMASTSHDLRCNGHIVPLKCLHYEKYVLSHARRFAFDLSPALLYANGPAVTGIIDSGISDYCEFKSLLGLFLVMEKDDKGNFPELFSVPCSKREVFETKLLSPLDKRRLMTFLRIASDYATAMTGSREKETTQVQFSPENVNSPTDRIIESELKEDIVSSLNERVLHQGRSLYRPQNKLVAKNDLEILQKNVEDNSRFSSYLKDQKLSDSLITIIIHAIAMADRDCSTSEGMNHLCQHLQSLGRFGSSAFLVPIYGSGELPQAFCRSAAVHGGTYLLRRCAKSVQLNESGDVIGVNIYDSDNPKILSPKRIATSNCIVPANFLPDFMTVKRKRVHRRISVVRGPIVPDQMNGGVQEQRHVIVVPPGDRCVCNTDVIYCIILDESSKVAPFVSRRERISIIHLITIKDAKETNQENEFKVLSRAMECLIKAGPRISDVVPQEIYHTAFSYDLIEASQVVEKNRGLHVCERYDCSLTVESSFLEAKRIFHSICPDGAFLKLSDAMHDIVKERQTIEQEEDDEFKLLESAMNMMGT